MRKGLSLALALAAWIVAGAAPAGTCPEGAQSDTEGVICPYVLRLRCPSRGRTFTGFVTEVRGEVGVVTALHAVAGCRAGEIADANSGRRLEAALVDRAHDAAFLAGPGLGEGLDSTDAAPAERPRVVGYPFGVTAQSGIYLDWTEPRRDPLGPHLPDSLVFSLGERNSPNIDEDVFWFVGELNRGHSGAPLLTPEGRVFAIGDGGLKQADSDRVWAIPLSLLDWSDDVDDTLAALAGKPAAGLASFLDEAPPPELPPLLFVDAFDVTGTIYRRVGGRNSIAFTWDGGKIYSLAVSEAGGRIVFSNANDNKIYEIRDNRARAIYTHHTYTRDVAFDSVGRIYFSEASGAGADGSIWRLGASGAVKWRDVPLGQVDGFWAGDFAFSPDDTIWVSSGNRVPSTLYRMEGTRAEPRYSVSWPIKGFVFVDQNTIVLADWRKELRSLYLPTLTLGEGFRFGTAEHLSDVARMYQPPSPDAGGSGVLIGYLVVPDNGRIERLADVNARHRLCGGPDDLGQLGGAQRNLAAARRTPITAAELHQAMQTGVCDGWLVRNEATIARLLGPSHQGFLKIEIFD